jgi:acyl-coenzyme A thioesterase PaaI-like protein
MPFDPQIDFMKWAEKLENTSPLIANRITMKALGFVSPFNSHLKAKLKEWKKTLVKIDLDCHRGVKNHVGSIHAGALFTLGETCAGLLIIKNFSFKNHRPLMSEVEVKYDKQARGRVYGVCEISEKLLDEAKVTLGQKEVPFIPMKTLIYNEKDELVATVKTKWQVKPWNQVRGKK